MSKYQVIKAQLKASKKKRVPITIETLLKLVNELEAANKRIMELELMQLFSRRK